MIMDEMLSKLRLSMIKHKLSGDSKHNEDAYYFYNKLNETFPWFASLNDARQLILIDLAFMGWQNLMSFTDMFESIAQYNFTQAARDLLDSKWAEQFTDKAYLLAEGMKWGEYDIGASMQLKSSLHSPLAP